jgi:hypothetical protein
VLVQSLFYLSTLRPTDAASITGSSSIRFIYSNSLCCSSQTNSWEENRQLIHSMSCQLTSIQIKTELCQKLGFTDPYFVLHENQMASMIWQWFDHILRCIYIYVTGSTNISGCNACLLTRHADRTGRHSSAIYESYRITWVMLDSQLCCSNDTGVVVAHISGTSCLNTTWSLCIFL